ncbi:CoA transferase [Paracoccus pantotrophus]|uniref:CoA transferase n=1 Tax=Paracoccus pantotrophus TaxID=82367 RepID=UPI00048EEFAA|nr:CoA transferase [Paracoccus pantotrophus]
MAPQSNSGGQAYLPLKGLRVIDLTLLIPGDLATRKLADLGAEVVKIEPPGPGDYLRHIPPATDGMGVHFWNLNRGKRSVALDLRAPADRAVFDSLADVADVIVEVSTPGKYDRLGIDFKAMRAKRPELVVCSISGFGQTGPWALLPSHGMNMDALGGNVITIPHKGAVAMDYRLSTSLASEMGAMNAAFSILAAVHGARTGKGGAWIDVSCWDAGFEIHRSGLVKSISGLDKTMPDLRDSVLYAPYECADGRLFIFCAIERKFWESFCRLVGREDLMARWQGPEGGVDYRMGDTELRTEMERIMAAETSEAWFEKFLEHRIPGCPLYEEQDLPQLNHTASRGLIRHQEGAPLPIIGDPVRYHSHDWRPGLDQSRAPALDADREEVIAEWLGQGDSDKAAIRALQLGYAHSFDSRNADAFAALYTPDAEITQHTGHVFAGHDKLRKAVERMPPANGGYHRIGATEIEISGETAQARCAYLARTADGRLAEGHYQDTYRKTDQGWKIATRAVFIDRWLETGETGQA